MQELLIKKIRPSAILPTRATQDSAGYDLYADVQEPVVILPRETAVIPTGIAMALPADSVGLVYGRSGLGIRHGIAPANAVGVIDADYRGEIQVGLRNHSEVPFTIQPGDRIAQLVLTPIYTPTLAQVSTLPESRRGQGGFGSTGR